MIFSLIDTEFDLKITFRILNPENHPRVIELKKKRINFLFIAVKYFPLLI